MSKSCKCRTARRLYSSCTGVLVRLNPESSGNSYRCHRKHVVVLSLMLQVGAIAGLLLCMGFYV